MKKFENEAKVSVKFIEKCNIYLAKQPVENMKKVRIGYKSHCKVCQKQKH